MQIVVAAPLAVAAAAVFSVAAVLQQRAARRAPESETLRPGLLLDLARRPIWLAGIGSLVLAYVLQAAALAFGPVTLVQPLVILELAFALPLAVRLSHRRAGGREWLGIGAVVAGVAVFLALADPHGGHATPRLVTWLLLAGPCAVATAGLVLIARGPETPRRATLLAVGCGVTNGLMAVLTKSMVTVLRSGGVLALVTSWQLYVVIATGVFGLLLAQSAFQSAPLAISLPVIDALEPTVAVLLATPGFHEQIATGAAFLAGEVLGAALAVVGVFLLGRSPLVLSVYEQTQDAKRRSDAAS